MKARIIILSLLGLSIVAFVAAAVWLYSSMDMLVKTAIETYGPEITQVPVRVGAVRLAPVDGQGEIRDLMLGNPRGFTAPAAIKAGVISLRVDPASLTRDVILVREVVIQSPDVSYETLSSGNNLETIQKNIEAYVARLTGGKQDTSGPKKKFIIEDVYIRGGHVSITTPYTAGRTLSSSLPDLHLRDVGKHTNGATAGDVARQIWDALLKSAANSASRLGGAISSGTRSAVDSIRKLFK